MVDLDEHIRSFVKELPISPFTLIIIMLNFGLALIAIYTIFIIAL